MELEEKVQILESTQEQLSEANAKIAILSAAPENNGKSLPYLKKQSTINLYKIYVQPNPTLPYTR